MFNFFEIFQIYLIPFAIAVPVVVLIFFFSFRKPEAPHIPDIVPEPAPAPADLAAEAARIRISDDIAVKTQLIRPVPHLGPGVADLGLDIDLEATAAAPLHGHVDAQDTVTPVQAVVRILVVDDSAVPRTKLRKLFEAHGYQVETANDGNEALAEIAKTHFNVVVTDLEMPNMNGVELIAAIHGSLDTEDLPVIAITGHEDMSARVHDISGLYGIFRKPWNDRDLLKRVEALANLRK